MTDNFATIDVLRSGTLMVGADHRGVFVCDWVDGRHSLSGYHSRPASPEATAAAVEQLQQYLRGQRRSFTVALNPGGTDFQRQVWTALMSVPYSTTITYRQLAERIGRPSAVRAVANAVAANPLSILIPCHRIVPADGSVGQYAGGAHLKRLLLELERNAAATALSGSVD